MLKRYRKFVTSSVGLTFIVVGMTGVTFKFFFKNHMLTEIHTWLGLAMVAAAALHIGQNWRALRNYFREPLVVALAIPVVIAMAFFAIKTEDQRRMNPRQVLELMSHAKASDVAKVFSKDVDQVLTAMKEKGLKVSDANETLEEIATRNDLKTDATLSFFVQ